VVTMTLTDRIKINPRVMLGKPVIRGTRIPVELILRKLSDGVENPVFLASLRRRRRFSSINCAMARSGPARRLTPSAIASSFGRAVPASTEGTLWNFGLSWLITTVVSSRSVVIDRVRLD
jgi:Protein of unknown function (DUF433)